METCARVVLVVDDDPAHRYSIGRRLSLAGFEVVEAETGEQAMRLAEGVDAVILDVQLPDMTGFDVCRRLREERRFVDLPIIQISAAYVATEDLVQGLAGGADAYLTRPVDDAVVVANLRALLRLRDDLARVNAELDQKRREQERANDLFIAMLNHDLRSPLDAIWMSGALLAKAPKAPEMVATATTRILAGASRMKHMLDDLQDYARSRLGSGVAPRPSPQRLGELAKAAIDEMQAADASARIELSVDGPDDGMWDGDRLGRVLTNLLRNAVQHGDRSHPIAVRVFTPSDGRRALTVRNQGDPIPDDVLRTLFQPMAPRATSASVKDNMGLGLFVCKEIVEAHGGTITVANDAFGTECRVELPTG